MCFAAVALRLGWADASDPLWFGHPSKRHGMWSMMKHDETSGYGTATINLENQIQDVFTCAILCFQPSSHGICSCFKKSGHNPAEPAIRACLPGAFVVHLVDLVVRFLSTFYEGLHAHHIVLWSLLTSWIASWSAWNIRYLMRQTYEDYEVDGRWWPLMAIDGCLTCRNLGLRSAVSTSMRLTSTSGVFALDVGPSVMSSMPWVAFFEASQIRCTQKCREMVPSQVIPDKQ